MNMKRTFGAILTILGIAGIIYGAYSFMNAQTNLTSIVPFVVGLIFFFSGLGLVKGTKDEA